MFQGLRVRGVSGVEGWVCFRGEGFPGGTVVKNLPANAGALETRVRSLGGEDPLEKGMGTRSSVLAWRIPRTEEHGGLQSMASQSQTRLSPHTCSMQG